MEIHNQHLEQLLRGNAFEPEKWLEKLPLAVYNLNATRNLTLGVSPIEAERGYQPRQPLDLLPDIIKDMKIHPDLSARFEALQRLQCEIRESIDLNNEKMNSDSKFDVFCAKVWGFPAESLHVEFELESECCNVNTFSSRLFVDI